MATQPQPDTTARAPLSRERILRAALTLADEGGVEAVTMRKLGDALGFEAMSLYRHVANKDDVLGGILDLVLAETETPPPAEDWDTAIRKSAVSVHDALRRHPWACGLLMSPAHVRAGRLQYMDSLLGSLRQAGFSADTTYHAYHVLDGHIFGFSLWETSHTMAATADPDLGARLLREIPFADYEYLAEHVDQHRAEGPHRKVSAFEYGLDLILDGLRKVHTEAASGPASAA
jgi:AcrR family transcriptional regulator